MFHYGSTKDDIFITSKMIQKKNSPGSGSAEEENPDLTLNEKIYIFILKVGRHKMPGIYICKYYDGEKSLVREKIKKGKRKTEENYIKNG